MKKTLAALLCLLFMLSGCLEFDAQEITIRYDEKLDRIDIHLVYRGLFAEGGGSDDLDKAVRHIASTQEKGEIAFWCNWPFAFDLVESRPGPIEALLAHIDVENGALFTDPQGQLCGQQFVRIREAKAFVQKLNTALELWVAKQLLTGTPGSGGTHTWDADTKDLVREFQRSGEQMLVVEPGRLELRLPLSAKDHTWFLAQMEKRFVDNMPREVVRRTALATKPKDEAMADVVTAKVMVPGETLAAEIQRSASFRFFWDNGISFWREPELTRLAFGVKGNRDLSIKKASDGLYDTRLLDRLREDKQTIEDGVPDQELVRRFEAFRGRDAVLPPAVAAKRGNEGPGKSPQTDKK